MMTAATNRADYYRFTCSGCGYFWIAVPGSPPLKPCCEKTKPKQHQKVANTSQPHEHPRA